MAALPAGSLTLVDWAKRTDPDGDIPVIANLLSQSNEILQDCVFVESNLPTGHQVTVTTGLPTVYWRSLNQGIPPSKATTAQVVESIGILEARSEVDKDLAMLNGNTAAFRLSESRMFLEAMNQEMADALFYADTATDPEKPLGLVPRYDDTAAGNTQNIIQETGSDVGAGNTSIWLIVWGPETVFCPFPKGSTAGLLHRDLGEQTVYRQSAPSGGTGASEPAERLQALVDWYQWKNGLCVKDWRYAVRIAGIDVSDWTDFSDQQSLTAHTNVIHAMTKAVYRIPNLSMGRPAFYMNRTAHSALSRMAMEKNQSVLRINDGLSQFGTPRAYMDFLGIPIRRVDAIRNNESAAS